MKVYVAGPMSGIPAFNIPAFDAAAEDLRALGHTVVSPAEVDGPITREVLLQSETGTHDDLPKDEGWSFYLARDFRILADEGIEAIVTLDGWETSKGARCEVAVGEQLGIPRYDYSEFRLYSLEGEFVTDRENPLRQRSSTGGVKDNRGKAPIDLIPYPALLEMAKVLEFGARKYKPHNWRLGLSWTQTWSSLQRHLWAFNEGEDNDPETGLPHLAHAMCQLAFLTTYFVEGFGEDDRRTSVPAEEAKA